jgi:DNA-binding beta-propeller fold protein YncE
LFVVDSGNNRIQKFMDDLRGAQFLLKWGSECIVLTMSPPCVDPDGNGPLQTGDGQFYGPHGISMDSRGKNVYVADTKNNRIQVFDRAGNFITKWGEYGTHDKQFILPSDVAVDPRGKNVYVADTKNNRIQVFDSVGNFSTKWGALGRGNGEFYQPSSVSVDSSGDFVYVGDQKNERVQKFTTNGTFISKWGSGCDLKSGLG